MTIWTKEQNEAITRDNCSIIVSAGAGSGKTAVLTERVIQKIKKGVSLKNLLILTFTKMAAKEMKERIEEKLKEENLISELKNIDVANITTFDSYALSVVKKYSYLLNVSKDISIIESSIIELYKKNTLTDIFEELYTSKEKKFLSLIKDYFIKDDRELTNFILNLDNKLNLKIDKISYLDNYLNKYFADEKITQDISLYTEEIKLLIDKINTYLSCIQDSKFLEKLELSLTPLLLSNTYDEIKKNISNLTLPRITKDTSEDTKKYKEKISDTIGEIKKLLDYESEEDIRRSILFTKDYIEVIINIIKKLDKKVRTYKEKYDSYEYHDISNLAIRLVRENKVVREEIKNNLNEILIDEYQDTNDLQETFISYISHDNVYMVGDIKQSIYRFRNANPYIFKEKYDNYSRHNGGIKIDLNKNFRSREEVIENINLFFNYIMDDTLGGADYTASHQMIFGNTSYNEEGFNNQNNHFEVYTYEEDSPFQKEEIEAFIIAKDIRDKVENRYKIYDKNLKKNRSVNYGDFAILIDNRKNFELFKKIFEYYNINTSIVKPNNLIDGEAVVLIKNIISLIIKIKNNEIDTEFKKLFTSLGRSFLFNYSDTEIFNYFKNNDFQNSKIYKISKEISDNIDNISIDSLLDIITDKYNFYQKLILIGDYHTNILCIDKLKEITENIVNLDYSIYDYQKYLEDIIQNNLKIEYEVNDISEDTTKIMTIHSSKGLEFNICYLAGLYSKFNIRDVINKFSYDEDYGIIIPCKDKFIKNTIYHNLSYKNYIKENISERIRLFYVALTRAKEKLIFLLPKKDGEEVSTFDPDARLKYKSFADILYSLESVIKSNYKSVDLESLNLSKDYNLIKKSNYKKEISTVDTKIEVEELHLIKDTEEEKSFSKKITKLITREEKNKLEYGRKIHELLELTDFNNPNYSLLSEKEKVFISNFLKQIDIKNANIYKEYEFAYEEDKTEYHGIIDLMLEYDDKIKIIDYKLKNISDTEYQKQLNGYKKYIENTFNKKTELYLYSIIDDTFEKL